MFQTSLQLNPYQFVAYYSIYSNYNGLMAFYEVAPNTAIYPVNPHIKQENAATNILATYQTSQNLPQISQKDQNYQFQNHNKHLAIINANIISNQQNKGRAYSPKSRNILPNNINLILSFIRRINKSGRKIEYIINKLNPSTEGYSAKGFYSYQVYLKDNLHRSLNKDALKNIINFCDPACSIFSIDEQLFYNKVCRILVRHFLKEQAIISLLHSKKMYKTKKNDHLQSYRQILDDLRQVLLIERIME